MEIIVRVSSIGAGVLGVSLGQVLWDWTSWYSVLYFTFFSSYSLVVRDRSYSIVIQGYPLVLLRYSSPGT